MECLLIGLQSVWKKINSSQLLLFVLVLVVSTGVEADSVSDIDSDEVPDVEDLDQDNDGIVNSLEGVYLISRLAESPARFYTAVAVSGEGLGSAHRYYLLDSDNGDKAELVAQVLETDTRVEWTMHDIWPKVRNLFAGRTKVQWTLADSHAVQNLDLTIGDLDGTREESVAVSASDIIGYSLSLNSNISVAHEGRSIRFVGTGAGGDSVDDLVTLHFRNVSELIVEYANGGADLTGTVGEIAGFRHSLDQIVGTYYYPVLQVRDSDGDLVPDHQDLDSDNDGLGDVVETGGNDIDKDNIMDGAVDLYGIPLSTNPQHDAVSVAPAYHADSVVHGDDLDNDGLLSSVDALPTRFGGSLEGTDSDADGLYDLDELRLYKTNPGKSDTDDDGLDDYSELIHHGTDPLLADTDSDGIGDADEIKVFGTVPVRADTDFDGVADGAEIEAGTDPLLPPNITDENPIVSLNPTQDNGDGVVVGLLDDAPDTDNQVAWRTGVNGVGGCSVGGSNTIHDPMLLILLLIASVRLIFKKSHV